MTLAIQDLRWYGSAVMPDDDTPTGVGGAIDTTRGVIFADIAGTLHGVSSAAGDTTQTVTVHYIDASGAAASLTLALTGQTPVTNSTAITRLLKAIKSATCLGDVAVEAQTAEHTGTAQGGAAGYVDLNATASSTAGAYAGMVARITGGTGAGQIRQIASYLAGATRRAEVARAWTTPPDATSTVRVSTGFTFEHAPVEIMEVRRCFYQAGADVSGGSARTYYEKLFWKNVGAETLSVAQVIQASGVAGVAFALATAKGDSGTTGAGNRQTAPAGLTFNTATKAVPTGSLGAGETIGTWLALSLAAGAAPGSGIYIPRGSGQTT